MKKIRFVQFDAGAWLGDPEFLMLDCEARGVYMTLVLYLLCNHGKLEHDVESLGKLCYIRDVQKFEKIWERVSHMFEIKRGYVKHKWVTSAMGKVKKYRQAQRKSGLKGAKKKWQPHSNAIGTAINLAMANETKGNVIEKESKYISNSNNQNVSSSNSVRSLCFNDALSHIIRPRTQSDRTCFHNVTCWLATGIATGKFNEQIYERVLDYAKEASKGRNPAAMFVALLKKELNYKTDSI